MATTTKYIFIKQLSVLPTKKCCRQIDYLIKKCRKSMNQKQWVKHTIRCFRRATYHRCVFNTACVGACECNRTPSLSGPGL